MITKENEHIWEEKYRPDKIDDCVLPSFIKEKALEIVKSEQLQNMLFYSGPGTGKTTLAIAICKELDLDYIVINGSKEGRLIETVRNTVDKFASTGSILGKHGYKVIIYDEFDNSGADVQKAIRGVMQDVSASCRFIFTGNYVTQIIEPLHSRIAMIDFSVPKDEQPFIMGQILGRCRAILDSEGIAYKPAVIAAFIKKYFPDFRKILNEFQSYAGGDKVIDEGILRVATTRFEELADFIMNKDYVSCKKWISSNSFDGSIYSLLEKELGKRFKDLRELEGVMIAQEHQYQHPFGVDPELSLKSYCVSMMGII